MGFLRRSDNAKPDYTSLQIQTSTSTLPIPIVWGTNKISPNVLWFANFQAIPGGSGKGIGGKGGLFGGAGAAAAADYTYTADIIMGLCEGPINTIGIVWKDLALYTIPDLLLDVFVGSTPQDTWPYLASYYPSNALAYQGTAYVAGMAYNLGDSAAIGNHNFEVYGILSGSGVTGFDADPALVIQDFLTDAQYGCGFDPANIDAGSLFTNANSLQAYCRAMGIAFSPALVSQEQASSILTRWLQLLSTAAVWSGGLLKFIPYGDTAISASDPPTTVTQQLSIPTPIPVSSGVSLPATVIVAAASQFVSDGGVTYASLGIPLTFVGAAFPLEGEYGMPSPGTYTFNPADESKPVIITYTMRPAGDFTPDLTPSYALTDSDFIDEKGNKDPVQVERVDVFSLPTIQRIEVLSRSNQYAAVPVEARDQSQIELFGARVGSTIQAHEICDEFTIGPLVAQTILQRELYVRTKFTFKLSWEYCLLDPMDIVTLTDANLGLSNYPVRVIQIEEDDKGLLSFTCEELVAGVSNPALNPNAASTGFQPNWGVPAVSVNPPLICEPPPSMTGGVAQAWIGASGISGGGQNQWGGANVYVSVDNVTYSQVAVLTGPMRQGVLTSSLPAAAGWDAVDTLSVDLTESGGSLSGTSQSGAQAGATLSVVDSEFLAYEAATLTGGNAYNLTGLSRGLGGSSAAPHPSGAQFFRVDGAVVRYNIPANFIGQTLYFKLQSFNTFGGGLEDLSTCQVYIFTPRQASTVVTAPPGSSGAPPYGPIFAQVLSGFPLDLGSVESAPTIAEDLGSVTSTPTVYGIDLGALTVTVTHPIATQLLSGSPLDLGLITAAVTASDDFGSVNDAAIDVINLGTVP